MQCSATQAGTNDRYSLLMNRTRSQQLLLPILLVVLGCVTRPSAVETVFVPEKLAEIDSAIQAAIEGGSLPGGVILVGRGEAIYMKAYGNRSLAPAVEATTSDTIYDAASLTKVLATAPSIYLLEERGLLGIDDLVSRHIPAFRGEGKDDITIRHLLTHTSGLRPGLGLSAPWSGYEEGVERAIGESPVTDSGFAFRYSDINYILLGEIVRRTAGMPLHEFAAREIYVPLKMTDTGFLPPASKRERIAPTERIADGTMLLGVVHDPTSRRMGGVTGHAGLFTTAADVARYARMLLGGGALEGIRVFRPETVAMMTSVQTPPNVTVRRGGGWDIDSNYSRPRGSLFPIGSFGHTGWTGTFLWIDPTSGTFYVFMSNRVHPDGKGSVITLQRELGTLVAQAVVDFDFTSVQGALPRRSGNITPAMGTAGTLNGIDVLSNYRFGPLRGLRIGLITNHTGIDRYGNQTIDLLRAAPGVNLVALFSPEHGIRGTLDAKVDDSVDVPSGLPIYSLYGERRKPSARQLEGIDALVFDIQDIGARFYTYISTLGLALEAAGEHGVKIFVLDRVNPITGTHVEGPLRDGEGIFTAWHPIVVRHGMTVGELAKMFNEERKLGAELTVVELENWSRSLWMDETGLPWIDTSPNMRSLTAATLYPAVGLLEATEMSVGRGTPTPFELFGAPYIDADVLAAELNAAAIPGVEFTPVRFTPDASVFAGEACQGVRLALDDRNSFNAVEAGTTFAITLHRLYPAQFTVEKVDRLLRHPPTIQAIEQGKGIKEVRAMWQDDLDAFRKRRAPFLLYRE